MRGARCCVTGTEPEVAEILATRGLRGLHLSRVAPTVLVSPFELDEVVARLRKAGFGVEEKTVRAKSKGGGARHVIWIATKA